MEQVTLLEDYNYLCKALLQHPVFCRENKKAEFAELSRKLQIIICDYPSFIEAATELTLFFGDGHTNIELPYTGGDTCLKLPCSWIGNRMVLNEKKGDIPAGSEILSVEDKTIPELVAFAETRIPHENIYLVKSRMVEYPYQNYHIFSGLNLKLLCGKKEKYLVKFLVEGKPVERRIPLNKYDGYLDFSAEPFVSLEVRDNALVFHLRECICNEEYKNALRQAAKLCKEKNLDVLELDLSKNMGGSSAVIDEFITYTHAESFYRYEMLDYSSGGAVCVSDRTIPVQNKKQDVLFPKQIVCRVSHTTFSSARTFAVTLKDNGIAKIIGEPTGGKPCSYGMPRRDVTPNGKLRFRVSRALFLRPDARLEEDALYPCVF